MSDSPVGPDAEDVDVFVSRFHRLTARELRLLILVVQDGLGYVELAKALGVSKGSVANTMQSIRRKLAVPSHKDLGAFVRSVPSLTAMFSSDEVAEAAAKHAEDTRRRKDLLRVTIDELQGVATRARRRARTLESFPSGEDDETTHRQEEAAMALRIAELVDDAVAQVLREVRRTN